MPDLRRRVHLPEMMDDFAITDARLTEALDNLRQVNRLLGGYASVRSALRPLLPLARRRPLRILDLGTGLADTPADLVRWGDAHGAELHVTGLDANAATVSYAQGWLDRTLPPHLRERVEVVQGDAFDPPGEHEVTVASLFLHHFDDEETARLLQTMHAHTPLGVVVSDLHRHPLAYHGIRLASTLLPVSPMFAHDAPLSVRRAFTADELRALAAEAGLPPVRVRWHWAFRWTLSTLPDAPRL